MPSPARRRTISAGGPWANWTKVVPSGGVASGAASAGAVVWSSPPLSRALSSARRGGLACVVVAPAEVELRHADDEEGGHRRGRGDGRRDHEGPLHGPEASPRIRLLRQGGEDLVAPLVGKLERRSRAEGLPARLQPPDLIRARPAGDEVLGDVAAGVGAELLLDEGEQLDLVGMLLGHHPFDSASSVGVPSRSASSLRPRKMRDFTVPSGTPVISATSA